MEIGIRFGYQGQEKDNEMKGVGNSLNYTYRMHDPRIGRFFAVDPLAASFSWNSPYVFSENRVIASIELEGLEAVDLNTGQNNNTLSGDNLDKYQNNDDYTPWTDLMGFKASDDLIKSAGKRNSSWANPNYRIQYLEHAVGKNVNLDYYSITIDKLPDGFNSPNLFLEFVRTNFNTFMKGGGSTFEPYSKVEKPIFESNIFLGSLMRFNIYMGGLNIDDASVITSKVQNNYWVFSTAFTPNDLGHPVFGNRQFGITTNDNGTYTFFTRGADRLHSGADVNFGGQKAFDGADKL